MVKLPWNREEKQFLTQLSSDTKNEVDPQKQVMLWAKRCYSPSDFQPAETTPGLEVPNPISQYYTM